MEDREESVQHFLDLIKRSRRGKFKIYIGMIAGVGKSYRMLQEAHEMLENGVDVQIGYIETHGRAGTVAMLEGLPVISRKKIFYKGKEVEEMDLDAILQLHPELVIVDELAHTNIEGSRNEKRWQDVMELLDAGINVISAVNIQQIESLNEDVKGIAGIEVKERIPDKVLQDADEVVNIDLTAEELINRLKAGKIYRPEKIQLALNNFFKTENILQLRELALKEVAFRVEKKVPESLGQLQERISAIIAELSNGDTTAEETKEESEEQSVTSTLESLKSNKYGGGNPEYRYNGESHTDSSKVNTDIDNLLKEFSEMSNDTINHSSASRKGK